MWPHQILQIDLSLSGSVTDRQEIMKEYEVIAENYNRLQQLLLWLLLDSLNTVHSL